MSPPNLPAPPDGGAIAPQTGQSPDAPLHADPDIAARLEFDPVPRKIKRPDGWNPTLQRDFIRRLAVSGSPQLACTEMGKNVTGIEALYKVPSAVSFRAAWDLAVELGRHAQGLDCGPPHLGPVPGITRRPPRGHAPSPPSGGEGRTRSGQGAGAWDEEDEPSDDKKADLLESLFGKYLLKLQAERTARLAGKVVEADFTLRQVTFFEVALDLGGQHQDVDVLEWMKSLRRGAHGLIDIARTPLSRFLDEARRMLWSGEFDEPDRPEPTNEDLFDEYTGYSLEPLEYIKGGPDADFEQKQRELEERWRKAAMEQVKWESTQRREQVD